MVIVADAHSRTDGSMHSMLERVKSKYPIVIVSRVDGFIFNKALKLPDKYILVDAVEMGWDWDSSSGTHFFGKNTHKYQNLFGTNEWDKLETFVYKHPPLVYFKRELLKEDATEYYRPIEYPATHSCTQHTIEEYNSRPIEVFFNWGLSNPMRPKLHGEIWSKMNNLGYIVCDNLLNINEFIKEESNPRKWLTVNTPHYARFPVEDILNVNGISKLSVCLWGAGRKCFRTTGESPLNSVMITPEDDMAYAYQWIDGINCVKIKNIDNAVNEIETATRRTDLYNLYVNGRETCAKYDIRQYISNYLEPIINNL